MFITDRARESLGAAIALRLAQTFPKEVTEEIAGRDPITFAGKELLQRMKELGYHGGTLGGANVRWIDRYWLAWAWNEAGEDADDNEQAKRLYAEARSAADFQAAIWYACRFGLEDEAEELFEDLPADKRNGADDEEEFCKRFPKGMHPPEP